MKVSKKWAMPALGLTAMLAGGSAQGAVMFSEDFSNGVNPGPNMSQGLEVTHANYGGSGAGIDYSSGAPTWGAVDFFRIHLDTNDTDYALVDFTMTADFTAASTSAWSSFAMGFGDATTGVTAIAPDDASPAVLCAITR